MINEQLYTANQRLQDAITQRNRQIRKTRRMLMELFDFLGDASIVPPLPERLSKWARKEIGKL